MPSNLFGSNLPPQVRSSVTATQRSARPQIATGGIAQGNGSFNQTAVHAVQESQEYWLDNKYNVNPVDDIVKNIDSGTGDNNMVSNSVHTFKGIYGFTGGLIAYPINGSNNVFLTINGFFSASTTDLNDAIEQTQAELSTTLGTRARTLTGRTDNGQTTLVSNVPIVNFGGISVRS